MKRAGIIVVLGFASLNNAPAYEIDTHVEVLTRQAVARTVLLTKPAVLRDLGIEQGLDQRFVNSDGQDRAIRQLIEDGARFEDSFFPTVRVTRHFYNPLTGAGLTAPSLGTLTASPDWALAPRESDSAQQFSYWDAKQYFLDALTKRVPAQRKRAFGLTFETLGRVVHHLQDMAQPQHVRNDPHCDKGIACKPLKIYAPSLYEEWTNVPQVRERIAQLYAAPELSGYDIASTFFKSTFNSPRNFWHTRLPGGQSPSSGRGMAEFTHRNFVSAGTNFRWAGTGFTYDPRFPLPLPFGVIERRQITDPDLLGPDQPLRGAIDFIASGVTDSFTGESLINRRASTVSIFDDDLEKSNAPVRSVTLNSFNFEAAYQHLTPRAVAYSAGLINYFFRGKIDLVEKTDSPGTWVLRNLGPESMKGTFTLYYDLVDDQRFPVPDARWENITLPPSDNENPGDGYPVSFQQPVTPTPAVPGEYMLVFNGDMGEEKAEGGNLGAVVGKRIAPRRSGFVVTPNATPSDGIGGPRLVSKLGNQWRLSREAGLLAGNIDWKGWYVNGVATEVLSWNGPKSRYLREYPERFSPEVYKDGEVFAVAPSPVLGAALNVDAQGREWLIVITKGETGEVIFRRANVKSNSPAIYDAANAPNGWREIGSITRPASRVDRPWFFNGPGTEAQAVTTLSSGTGRIKLTVSDASVATSTQIPYVSTAQSIDVTDRPAPETVSSSSGCENNAIESHGATITRVRHDVENAGAGVLLAVDYDDEEELIAESTLFNVLYYQKTETRTSQTTVVYDSVNGRYLNCDGPVSVKTSDNFYRSEEHNNVSFNSIQRLRFAGLQIDLNRPLDRIVEVIDKSTVGQVTNYADPSQSSPGTSASTTTSTRNYENNNWYFAYLNLRDRAALIYRQTVDRTTAYNNGAVVSQRSRADEQLDIHSAGAVTTHVLGSGAPGTTINGRPTFVSNYDVGYASDLAGNELYSIRFPAQIFNPGSVFYFNHLTGAVLGEVIPLSTPQALYAPVGLVK